MDNENEQSSSPVSSSGPSNGGSSNPRPQVSQMSLYERQAVQALQALQRQPNAAAQYLQQMYAVQHQHLMLQQHLNSAQLQSLAAVQQVTLAASRQVNSSSSSETQTTGTSQTTLNLASSSGAAAGSRTQTISSPVSTSNNNSLTPTQPKMYLQTQLPQPGSLLQVARTLSRNVPQLILMPGGSVTAVQQPEGTASSGGQQPETEQAQNLALRNQQTLSAGIQAPAAAQKTTSVVVSQSPPLSPAQTVTVSQPTTLNLSQSAGMALAPAAPVSQSAGMGLPHPAAPVSQSAGMALAPAAPASQSAGMGLPHPAAPVSQSAGVAKGQGSGQAVAGGGHPNQPEAENLPKKPEGDGGQSCGINLTRSITPTGQTLISSASAYGSIAPHPLLHQHLQQKQLLIQQQLTLQQPQHRSSQTAPGHQAPHGQTLVVQPLSQAQPASQAQSEAQPHKPQASGLSSLLPKQPIQPVKAQGGPAQSQLASKFVSQGHGLSAQAQAQEQASGPTPAPSPAVQQNSASTQTLVVGLPQAQSLGQGPAEQTQAQAQAQGPAQTHPHLQAQGQPPEPIPSPATPRTQPATPGVSLPGTLPQQPLPLKTVVVGVKRKAEIEDESVFTEKHNSPSLEPPQLIPNQLANQEQEVPVGGKGEVIQSGPPVLTSISSLSAPPLLKVSTRYGGDIKPPQAIVKPHILTHVIEGFVIQEGAEPFPVDSALASADQKQKQQGPPVLHPEGLQLDRQPIPQTGSEVVPELLKCEFCGRLEQAEKFKRSKRFCSMACAKRYNVSCRKGVRRFTMDKLGPLHKDSDPRIGRRTTRKGSGDSIRTNVPKKHLKEDPSRVSENSSYDEVHPPHSPNLVQLRHSQCDRDSSSGAPAMPDLMGINPSFRNGSPVLWSVEQVHDFICSLPGCQDLAEEFRSQEIDGQALLLLKEEHLMTAMNMKLGPALKICARINLLKEP